MSETSLLYLLPNELVLWTSRGELSISLIRVALLVFLLVRKSLSEKSESELALLLSVFAIVSNPKKPSEGSRLRVLIGDDAFPLLKIPLVRLWLSCYGVSDLIQGPAACHLQSDGHRARWEHERCR